MSASFRFTLRMDATASLRFLRPVAWPNRPMSFLSWSWGRCCDDPWGANICAGTSMDPWCQVIGVDWCRFGVDCCLVQCFWAFGRGIIFQIPVDLLSNEHQGIQVFGESWDSWAAASTCGKRPGLSELATRLTSAFCGLPRRGTTP